MDSNIQALFTHLTHYQVKAVLQLVAYKTFGEKMTKISMNLTRFVKKMTKIRMNSTKFAEKNIKNLSKSWQSAKESMPWQMKSKSWKCQQLVPTFHAQSAWKILIQKITKLMCSAVLICSKCLHPAIQPDVNLLLYKRTRNSGLISSQFRTSKQSSSHSWWKSSIKTLSYLPWTSNYQTEKNLLESVKGKADKVEDLLFYINYRYLFNFQLYENFLFL